MEALPTELIETVLINPKLTIEDVVHFGKTCSKFRDLTRSNSYIWKIKYMQTWPHLFHLFGADFQEWFEEVIIFYNLRKTTHELLAAMPSNFHKQMDLSESDFGEWAVPIDSHPRAYFYVIEELMRIVHTHMRINSIKTVPLNTPGNKTLKFYASKVLRHLKQRKLKEEWMSFSKLPNNEQIMEKCAIFVAQWSQPHHNVIAERIVEQLDDYARKTLEILHDINPRHPIFRIPVVVMNQWRGRNHTDNQFDTTHCREILQAIRAFLYDKEGFQGSQVPYYTPANSFIDKVIENKHGLPIILAVIFEGIARRLGLRCDPISFPAHFLLRFNEGQEHNRTGDSYYIDVYNQGRCIYKGACPHNQNHYGGTEDDFKCATAAEVVERMSNNLEMSSRQYSQPSGRMALLRSSLELLYLVNPTDITNLVNLSRLYMNHEMDVEPISSALVDDGVSMSEGMFERISRMLNNYQLTYKRKKLESVTEKVRRRSEAPQVKYAVGMIMRHVILDYLCVIYDWDPFCLASQDWKMQMGVHKLRNKDQQPFYNVLDSGGNPRYVAQENIVPVQSQELENEYDDLGKYFTHFFETHYVPSVEKEKEYPDDAQVRYFYHQKLREGAI